MTWTGRDCPSVCLTVSQSVRLVCLTVWICLVWLLFSSSQHDIMVHDCAASPRGVWFRQGIPPHFFFFFFTFMFLTLFLSLTVVLCED